MLNVSDIDAAKEFYIEKLGLQVLEMFPKFFAARAGDVRISVFPGGRKLVEGQDSGVSVILRTEDVDQTITELTSRGVLFEGPMGEAPQFMRFVSFLDPDGNRLYLAQYLGDPFAVA